MTEDRVIPGGTSTWYRDVVANDSDKTVTVPTGELWEIDYIDAELATTATVGNRSLYISITDGTNALMAFPFASSIAASKTGIVRLFVGAGEWNNTAAQLTTAGGNNADVGYKQGIQPIKLNAGSVIRIRDFSAIDAAADDLTIIIHYMKYQA